MRSSSQRWPPSDAPGRAEVRADDSAIAMRGCTIAPDLIERLDDVILAAPTRPAEQSRRRAHGGAAAGFPSPCPGRRLAADSADRPAGGGERGASNQGGRRGRVHRRRRGRHDACAIRHTQIGRLNRSRCRRFHPRLALVNPHDRWTIPLGMTAEKPRQYGEKSRTHSLEVAGAAAAIRDGVSRPDRAGRNSSQRRRPRRRLHRRTSEARHDTRETGGLAACAAADARSRPAAPAASTMGRLPCSSYPNRPGTAGARSPGLSPAPWPGSIRQ